jgi:hypothetical protein
VVYAKPPFGGPQQVLEYLGRYTHRVAISNQRLLALENGHVSFQWKDYRTKDSSNSKVMTLEVDEFIRRFLLHALPPGLQRIRYGGFLANCHRKDSLTLCRQLLAPLADLLPHPPDLPGLVPDNVGGGFIRYRHSGAPLSTMRPRHDDPRTDAARLPLARHPTAGLLMTTTGSSPLHHIAARYGAHATAVSGYRDRSTDRAQFSTPPDVFRHSPAWITSLAHAEAPIHQDQPRPIQGLASDSRHSTPIPLLTDSAAV